jgi:hypothetical protein
MKNGYKDVQDAFMVLIDKSIFLVHRYLRIQINKSLVASVFFRPKLIFSL